MSVPTGLIDLVLFQRPVPHPGQRGGRLAGRGHREPPEQGWAGEDVARAAAAVRAGWQRQERRQRGRGAPVNAAPPRRPKVRLDCSVRLHWPGSYFSFLGSCDIFYSRWSGSDNFTGDWFSLEALVKCIPASAFSSGGLDDAARRNATRLDPQRTSVYITIMGPFSRQLTRWRGWLSPRVAGTHVGGHNHATPDYYNKPIASRSACRSWRGRPAVPTSHACTPAIRLNKSALRLIRHAWKIGEGEQSCFYTYRYFLSLLWPVSLIDHVSSGACYVVVHFMWKHSQRSGCGFWVSLVAFDFMIVARKVRHSTLFFPGPWHCFLIRQSDITCDDGLVDRSH